MIFNLDVLVHSFDCLVSAFKPSVPFSIIHKHGSPSVSLPSLGQPLAPSLSHPITLVLCSRLSLALSYLCSINQTFAFQPLQGIQLKCFHQFYKRPPDRWDHLLWPPNWWSV